MSNKLLVVYNTCGISGRSNVVFYRQAINSILNQNFKDIRIVLSSCYNTRDDFNSIYSTFSNLISYNYIQHKLPINITFNHTCLECIKHFGEFEGYLYIDSGCKFTRADDISNLYDLFKSGPYGMVSARTDTDTGFQWLYKTKDSLGNELFEKGDFIIPVGGAANAHVIIYSNLLFQNYGKVLSDIFAGQCSESVQTFICAALKTNWIISKDIVTQHSTGVDGPSAGFSPDLHAMRGKKKWDHLFGTDESILDIISRGKEFGMGYEEFQQIVMHNKDKFDESGFALDDRLKDYIKDNLFLKQSQFDYNSVRHQFVS